jgi:hypothetical protein
MLPRVMPSGCRLPTDGAGGVCVPIPEQYRGKQCVPPGARGPQGEPGYLKPFLISGIERTSKDQQRLRNL